MKDENNVIFSYNVILRWKMDLEQKFKAFRVMNIEIRDLLEYTLVVTY